jgi:hypothetical protein
MIKNNSFIKIFLLLILHVVFSCRSNKLERVSLFFYEKKMPDSIVFVDSKTIEVFNDFMTKKKEVYYKFPCEYFIKLYYTNGTFEEYDGNGALLRGTREGVGVHGVFTVEEPELKRKYLEIISPYMNQRDSALLRDTQNKFH